MAVKILIIGAVNGNLATLLPKLTMLHTKQNFTMAVIVGDLFPPEASDDGNSGGDELLRKLLRGEFEIPLPVYFSIGRSEMSEAVTKRLEYCLEEHAGEVCPNLVFLGRKGVLVTSEGVRVVVLGGRLGAPQDEQEGEGGDEGHRENTRPWYTEAEANVLRGANSADILVTYDWPADVDRNSKVPIANGGSSDGKGLLPRGGSTPVRELARRLRPRYHFVSGGERVFWEREPYRNEGVERERESEKGYSEAMGGVGLGVGATRFIALADWGNEGKVKALYAFNLNVEDRVGEVVPANATVSPYTGTEGPSYRRKRPLPPNSDTPDGSFFWGEHDRRFHQEKRHRDGGHQRKPLPGHIQTHLIISIGNDSYLTTARGPLTTKATNPPTLPFPAHVLIIPLAHATTLEQVDDSVQTYTEMLRFRSALDRMFRACGAGAVCFEVARGTKGVHAHWQVVPVRKEKLASVMDLFRVAANRHALGEFVERSGDAFLHCREDSLGDSYFRVWVSPAESGDCPPPPASGSSSAGLQVKSENEGHDQVKEVEEGEVEERKVEEMNVEEGKVVEEEDKWLCLPLIENQPFDLQFGRKVLAGVIGGESEGRWHWQDCKQSVSEEKQDAAAFKSAFQPWDFTI